MYLSCFNFITYLLLFINVAFCFTCKNENNEEVDWYVLYKLPIEEHISNELIKDGVAYMYITSKDEKVQWKLSTISINQRKSIPGLTLKPYYDNLTSMHILYNDETPSGTVTENLGHTKGVLLSNDSTGLWLIHSVPRYPPENNYSYPESGIRNGQSFLCISFNLENINNIGLQLKYNEPYIFKSFIKNNLKKKLIHVNSVINKEYIKSPPWHQILSIFSLKGNQFVSFAKSKKFGKELYEDWIAVALKSSLFVETWLNGSGKIPSDCSKIYQVNNVKEIQAVNGSVIFSSSKDHSKWAVTNSKSATRKWICIGDINREEHQKHRGGGSVCIPNLKLWKQYSEIIADTEACHN